MVSILPDPLPRFGTGLHLRNNRDRLPDRLQPVQRVDRAGVVLEPLTPACRLSVWLNGRRPPWYQRWGQEIESGRPDGRSYRPERMVIRRIAICSVR